MRIEHLYVHVPFCARRCVYCDFSIAVRSRIPAQEYLVAARRELEQRHAETEFPLGTLYFGGGTPSKLPADGVRRLVDLFRARVRLDDDCEVTLEANPEDVTPDNASAWHSAGVNRVSLGVQSFDASVLAWMHRTHGAGDAARAVEVLRDAGIENISIDLIFAVPTNLGRVWERDLERALSLRVPHLSVYGLTIEPHTPLGRWVARMDTDEAPEESFEREFLLADAMLAAHGYEHYEVSNYAMAGRRSRHNSAYWLRRPYGGIGPSAHEFTGSERRWNVGPYAEWVRILGEGADPLDGREVLDTSQVRAEEVYLGLRSWIGLPVSDAERSHVSQWVDAGWAKMTAPARVHLTPSGWLRLDALCADLTHVRSRY